MNQNTPQGSAQRDAETGRLVRWCLAAAAGVCFAVGWVGIFVPGLPTTIFWLLAVLLAGKACPVLRQWIYKQGPAGHAVHDIVERNGMTRTAKRHALIGMWAMLAISSVSMFVFLPGGNHWFALLPVVVGLGVTAYIMYGLKTLSVQRMNIVEMV